MLEHNSHKIMESFSIPGLLATSVFAYIAYSMLVAIYNITLHPLSKFPGPKIYAAFYFPGYWDVYKGDTVHVFKKQHEKYGPVVRVTPNRLSFTTAQAFTDIYATKRDNGWPLIRDPEMYTDSIPQPTKSLILADVPNHKRQRRLMSYAFSEAALRDQEDIVHHYCDLLITRLHEKITGPEKGRVDIARWFNFTTFDIIGDLAFAESFHSLETGQNSLWMTTIFENLKSSTIFRIARAYPVAHFVLQSLVRSIPSVGELIKTLKEDSTKKMARRMGSKTDRKDFTSHFMKHNKGSMTTEELTASADLFITAGSETSATLLSGSIFILQNNPHAFGKLRAEIDGSFHDLSEMTFVNEAKLPYLQACIQEALRLYPPAPFELPRLTPPEGTMIGGIFVPGNTSVAVHHLSTYHSSRNFTDPTEFHPERFLGDKRYASDDLSALQPFSVGPANCIGQNLAWAEIRSIIARIIWNFDIELSPECANWMDQKTYFVWKKDPLMVKLSARNHA